MPKVNLIIDGKQIVAEKGKILLEVARENGISIPSLCHDSRLKPFGSCRMCVVEIEGMRGAVQSCGIKVSEGMVVKTNTDMIIGLRRTALELLLTEHCGDCIAPCQVACPATIDIQGFIAHIANGQVLEAAKLIREKLPFPASIGRVCPRFCETACRRNLMEDPISICFLKRYAGDEDILNEENYESTVKPDTGKRVAVIGGGPAGLAAAYYLALNGHRVTIFDSAPELGGMMKYGIPEYRLPKAILNKEIEAITDLCENVFCNKALGKDFTIKQLKLMGFDSVFVGIGSWLDQSLRCPGENLKGVYSGIDFLGKVAMNKPVEIGKKVVVVGGGNTAMDATRTAIRMGADEVTIVYRRSRNEMPASSIEVDQAEEEGVKLQLLSNPVGFVESNGKVTAVKCVRMELGEPDSSGRRRPIPIEGSEFDIPVDSVITATGQKLDTASLVGNPELALDKWKNIAADPATLQTNIEWLFSGGDCVTGPATAVEASAAGRTAAISINQYLSGEAVVAEKKLFNCSRGTLEEMDPAEFEAREKISRTHMPTIGPAERKGNFKEFELGFTKEMAEKEASRCLSCGCMDCFDCRLREYATELGVNADHLGVGEKRFPITDNGPYIISDSNKCVLCGNCIRMCQEVQGVGILGFVNRGSNTVVMPGANSENLCKSCGQCVAICPTGALTFRSTQPKPGPFKVNKVDSVCPNCSIGCKLDLNMVGERVDSITSPICNDTVNQGDLCNKGSLTYNAVQSSNRLLKPMLNNNGKLEESSWTDAFNKCTSLLKGIDGLSIAISPTMTNEENIYASKLGQLAFGTSDIFSTVPVATNRFALDSQNNEKVTFNGMMNSDLIIAVGNDFSQKYPIAAHKFKSAAEKNAALLLISSNVTPLHTSAKASLKITDKKLISLFETFIGFVLENKLNDEKVSGKYPQLIEALAKKLPGDYYEAIQSFFVKPEKIVEFIRLYLKAENPIIVVDGDAVSPELLELITALAFITGKSGTSTKGVMTLYPKGNTQGQLDMGIQVDTRDYQSIVAKIKSGKIKGLLVFGTEEELAPELLQDGVKTILITPFLPKKQQFDIVLPSATFAETNGSYTNVEGRIQPLKAGFSPLGGKNNLQIISDLAKASGYSMDVPTEAQAYSEVISKLFNK
ncbi:MAG: FAD-dependent oxidoreductase [Eubacteriales bacterium]